MTSRAKTAHVQRMPKFPISAIRRIRLGEKIKGAQGCKGVVAVMNEV
jgi:hypothetical protein